MTDQNISEKISDTITSIIIKKTNIFERLDNMKDLIKVSTGIFIVTATITIINYYYIKQIELKSDEQVKLIKDMNKQLFKNINDNSSTHFKLYQELQAKIDRLLEIDIEIQNQNNTLLQKYEKKYVSVLTSMSDFQKYSNPSTIENKDTHDDVDNELLQECYDVLPCNNATKVTSSGFFSWK
jgi:hypothetical protein